MKDDLEMFFDLVVGRSFRLDDVKLDVIVLEEVEQDGRVDRPEVDPVS